MEAPNLTEFSYRVKLTNGNLMSGTIEALNEVEALKQLSAKRMAILDLREVRTGTQGVLLTQLRSVKVDHILTFFTQFSFMLKAGLPLFHSLEMVISQTEDDRLSAVLKNIRQDLSEGKSLSEAMRKYPRVFTKLHANMIIIGESSGKLDEALDRIIKVIQEEQELKKKVKSAARYPVIMLSIALMSIISLLTFVFPKFSKIFEKAAIDLPLMTSIYMKLSELILGHALVLSIALVVVIGAFIAFFRTSYGRYLFDMSKLKIPIIRSITTNILVADFARNLGSLLAAGVTLVQALEICRDTIQNVVIRPYLTDLVRDVREGSRIHEVLGRCKYFPDVFVQLIAIGEDSGELDVMMDNINVYYRTRIDESIEKFTSYIEPIMMGVLGAVVLSVALSILLPMFKLSSAIKK